MVVDLRGRPRVGAWVGIRLKDPPEGVHVTTWRARTDEYGRFEIDRLVPGVTFHVLTPGNRRLGDLRAGDHEHRFSTDAPLTSPVTSVWSRPPPRLVKVSLGGLPVPIATGSFGASGTRLRVEDGVAEIPEATFRRAYEQHGGAPVITIDDVKDFEQRPVNAQVARVAWTDATAWVLEIELEVGLRIAGVATNASGEPLPFATLRCLPPGGSPAQSATADGEGRFVIDRLAPGRHNLFLTGTSPPDGARERFTDPLRIQVEAGASNVVISKWR